jgi:hypothetical protein
MILLPTSLARYWLWSVAPVVLDLDFGCTRSVAPFFFDLGFGCTRMEMEALDDVDFIKCATGLSQALGIWPVGFAASLLCEGAEHPSHGSDRTLALNAKCMVLLSTPYSPAWATGAGKMHVASR